MFHIARGELISRARRTRDVRATTARTTTILPLIRNRRRTTSPHTRRRRQRLTFSRRTTNRRQHRIRRRRGRRRRNSRHHSTRSRTRRRRTATVGSRHDNADRVFHIVCGELISRARRTRDTRATIARAITILPLIDNRRRTTSPSARSRGKRLTFSSRTTNRRQHRIRRRRGRRRRRDSRNRRADNRRSYRRTATIGCGHENTNSVFDIARAKHIARGSRAGDIRASFPGGFTVLPLIGKGRRSSGPSARGRGKHLTFSCCTANRRQHRVGGRSYRRFFDRSCRRGAHRAGATAIARRHHDSHRVVHVAGCERVVRRRGTTNT